MQCHKDFEKNEPVGTCESADSSKGSEACSSFKCVITHLKITSMALDVITSSW